MIGRRTFIKGSSALATSVYISRKGSVKQVSVRVISDDTIVEEHSVNVPASLNEQQCYIMAEGLLLRAGWIRFQKFRDKGEIRHAWNIAKGLPNRGEARYAV